VRATASSFAVRSSSASAPADQRLEIHDEQRARPAIDRKIVCHCWSCSYVARGVMGRTDNKNLPK
jgi:hypothetical protein